MVEFGEKLKQIREERGLTQQTLAEKLYVTRQAVSRWECGARYPDLLTAKKIATILEVTLDELLSGEELRENVEKEPVLARPVENIVQTVLYAVAAVAYLLLCIFSIYSYVRPNEALANTPAGQVTLVTVSGELIRLVHFVATAVGLYLSARNKLTARITGMIMCVPYVLTAVSFSFTYIDMQVKKNGNLGLSAWVTDFLIPLAFAAGIVLFFGWKERRIPLLVIWGICLLTLGYLAYVYRLRFMRFTDLGLVVTTVHMVGKMGMAALLAYQAYVWDKKRKLAYESSGTDREIGNDRLEE